MKIIEIMNYILFSGLIGKFLTFFEKLQGEKFIQQIHKNFCFLSCVLVLLPTHFLISNNHIAF